MQHHPNAGDKFFIVVLFLVVIIIAVYTLQKYVAEQERCQKARDNNIVLCECLPDQTKESDLPRDCIEKK